MRSRVMVGQNQYKDQIAILMLEDDKRLKVLHDKEHAFEMLSVESLKLKKALQLQKDQLFEHQRRLSRVDVEIANISDANMDLVDKIKSIDREIGHTLEQLGMIKEVRTEFLDNIEQVNHYEHKLKSILEEMVRQERTLPIAKQRYTTLQKEIALFKKNLASQEELLMTLKLETELSKEQHRIKKFASIREIEAQEEKEKSYKKALSLIKDRIQKGRRISFVEVDRLVKRVDGGILKRMNYWGRRIIESWRREGDPKGV